LVSIEGALQAAGCLQCRLPAALQMDGSAATVAVLHRYTIRHSSLHYEVCVAINHSFN